MREVIAKYYLMVIALFVGITPAFLTILILIVSDTITGVWKAMKKGEEIQSSKLFSIITKFIIYSVSILCAITFEQFIIESIVPLSKIILGLIAAVELRSVYENVYEITNIDIWKKIKGLLDRKED